MWKIILIMALLGYKGRYCEVDVDECIELGVSCGPGVCSNLDGGYICKCAAGFCGNECALPDPCFAPAPDGHGSASSTGHGSASSTDGNGTANAGPCLNGGTCEQRCAEEVAYICHCTGGWGGLNCSQQVVAEGAMGSDTSATVLIAVGAALLALALLGGALAALAAQARRKRATRGTYSPSGQEYCNPRAEMMAAALKPPPEERLI